MIDAAYALMTAKGQTLTKGTANTTNDTFTLEEVLNAYRCRGEKGVVCRLVPLNGEEQSRLLEFVRDKAKYRALQGRLDKLQVELTRLGEDVEVVEVKIESTKEKLRALDIDGLLDKVPLESQTDLGRSKT